MGNSATKIKEDTYTIENKIKNGKIKLFDWGWFKFSKCFLGVFLYSLAVNLFIVPNHLYTGGILGLSQIIRTILVSNFNLHINFDISSIIYYIFNLPLLILAYKKINRAFLVRTIYTVTLNSLLLFIIPIPTEPLIQNLLANVMIGRYAMWIRSRYDIKYWKFNRRNRYNWNYYK